ncbi:MAG TPA: TonB-dependent receptor, partial [Aequorivita sp.]|nr:TonB-dependent receptor [Aequorivita sp.]
NYDFQKGSDFYAYVNVDASENAVVATTNVDANNIRNTTYANVNGKYSIRGSASTNRKHSLDSLRSIKTGIGVYGNFSQDVNFNNGLEYKSHNFTLTPNANLSFSWQELFDIRVYYSLGISKNSFENNIFEDRNYLNHSVKLSTSLYVPKNFEWKNEIDFDYNPDIAPGFQKSAWFWNSTLAYSLLKEQGTLTLKVYDLLNQNTNARRTFSENFIQDNQSTVLRQ